jgi:hypothetical protein
MSLQFQTENYNLSKILSQKISFWDNYVMVVLHTRLNNILNHISRGKHYDKSNDDNLQRQHLY